MRILYVHDNLEFGGGARWFTQLARGLRDRHEILFACSSGGVLGRRLGQLGVPLRPLDFGSRVSPTRIARLCALIRRERVTLVHSMGARADFSARVAARLAGAPLIVSTIAMLVEGYEGPSVRRALYGVGARLTERLADGFIAVSDAVRTALVKDHRIPPEKVVRVYAGIELEEYAVGTRDPLRLRRELALDRGAPVVGTIGRLVSQKAGDVFLKAAAQVVKAVPNAQFLIVGDGLLRPRLERLQRELDLRGVRFTGFREDIPELLSIMDVFALSSVLEGVPRTLLEALGMARPVVATRIDGVGEVIQHGANGLLVPPRDPVALARAITALLNDRELARRLGETGRRLVEERFTVGRMVEEVDRFYTTLLREKALVPNCNPGRASMRRL